MTEIKYKNFTVHTTLELPVTENNYWRHHVWIRVDNKPFAHVDNHDLSMGIMQALLSGCEDRCLAAIKMIIEFREYTTNNLKTLCSM